MIKPIMDMNTDYTATRILGYLKLFENRREKIMKQKIDKIMCCCGNGVGTSLLMQMTIEEALEILGAEGIEVTFGSLSDVAQNKADLFVMSQELLGSFEKLPIIGLENLMDSDEVAEKLRPWIENER